MVTGAGGNLGRKLVTTLAGLDRCSRIVAVDREDVADRFPASARSRVQMLVADLALRSGGWVDAMSGLDAVVHLAALHPYPNATWDQAFASCDMTMNVLLEALRGGLPRVVFASSNHVMGGYKDLPLAASMGPGKLTTDLQPAPGTRRFDGEKFCGFFAVCDVETDRREDLRRRRRGVGRQAEHSRYPYRLDHARRK